jgi:serine/threonine-protein kinase
MADRIGDPHIRSRHFQPPPLVAGRYAIDRQLGRGSTAHVWLAHDETTKRAVAVKILRQRFAHAVGAKRFLREIAITSRLSHPHILEVLDSGEADRLLFHVTPYIEGNSLRTRLARERQLPIDDTIRIAAEIADALQFAHERGVIHRDVKPENILLGADGALVSDFGIAYALQASANDWMTTSGFVLGTPAYMSPEQAAGERDLDGRSDQYGLACVLYELLAGIPPFIGPTPESVIAQRFSVMPRPVRVYRSGVPPQVDAAITRALALTPADRFPSVRAFADAM